MEILDILARDLSVSCFLRGSLCVETFAEYTPHNPAAQVWHMTPSTRSQRTSFL
jgi:hypothetical protein